MPVTCTDADTELLLQLVGDLDDAIVGEALCPACATRLATTSSGQCAECDSGGITPLERARARKRRWWAENGRAWRAARKAATAAA